MIVRLKVTTIILAAALLVFQFYDSPIKRRLQVVEEQFTDTMFQFYDSPIKSFSLTRKSHFYL